MKGCLNLNAVFIFKWPIVGFWHTGVSFCLSLTVVQTPECVVSLDPHDPALAYLSSFTLYAPGAHTYSHANLPPPTLSHPPWRGTTLTPYKASLWRLFQFHVWSMLPPDSGPLPIVFYLLKTLFIHSLFMNCVFVSPAQIKNSLRDRVLGRWLG